MSPVPSACQPLADHVSELEQQYAAAAARASGATGAEAWASLAEAGGLLRQLDEARAELDACVTTHSAALIGTVAVIDATGGAAGPRTATLWDLTGTGPIAAEIVEIQAGAFGFAGPLPAAAAVSLAPDRSADASLTGVDFRSGPLPPGLGGPQPQLEVVIAPKLTIAAQQLRAWASTFQSTTQEIGDAGGLLGRLRATVIAPALTLTAGAVRVAATGTVTPAPGGPGALLGIPSSFPFSASITFTLGPATDPHATEVVSVALAGQNPISLELPGVQHIVGTILPLVAPFVGDQIRTSLAGWINQLVPGAIARGLALAGLPPSTQVSLRSLTVSEASITVQPVLGAAAPLLSTFQPTTLPGQ